MVYEGITLAFTFETDSNGEMNLCKYYFIVELFPLRYLTQCFEKTGLYGKEINFPGFDFPVHKNLPLPLHFSIPSRSTSTPGFSKWSFPLRYPNNLFPIYANEVHVLHTAFRPDCSSKKYVTRNN